MRASVHALLHALCVLAQLALSVHAQGPWPGPGPGPGSGQGPGEQMQSRAVETRVQLEILEGQPRGTVVGGIPTKPGFTYRFNEPPRQFTLNATTGEIRTTTVLDRESLRNERYDLVVLSSQPTYPIEVRIVVVDVNDNSPEFPESSIAVSFSESAAAGTRLLLDAASDKDQGANGVSNDYQIVDGNVDDKFRLEVTDNPAGGAYLHLETTGKLDRETRANYRLNISARDGGTPPRHGYLQVNVTILDVNDNPPIFDHSDYTVSLNESVTPGSAVLQVMATDSDEGDNAKITYYLADLERQFVVDPETGVITTTESLDCPHQQSCPQTSQEGENAQPRRGSCPKSCVFTVFARDHGSPRQDGRTYVTVSLVDANDHDPTIRFNYFPATSTFATVDENAANGSVVAAISVVDKDEGLNGATTVGIAAGNELNHFRLDSLNDFDIVRVNGILDREQINKYNLTIVAADKGSPPRTATAFLIIQVNDVNDHEPVFTKSEYSAVLSELAPPGTYVAGITATDEDTGVNAQIYYAIVSGNDQQWFHVDAGSGLVTTRAALDREIQGTVELNISARDGGPNPKWAFTQLKVTILDENDESPRFSQDVINVSLPEGTPPNTLVAMLTAADHDQGTNGSVTYSLQADALQRYPGAFALDSITGQLTTKAKLDREAIPSYEIVVLARDQGSPLRSSTSTVHLTVSDVNDNSPVFYPVQYFVHVHDDTPLGTSVARVTAQDADEGDNAEIRFAVESGGEGLFHIDEATGVLSIKSPLRAAQKSLYRLRVSARDAGDRRAPEDALIEVVKTRKLEKLEFESERGYDFQVAEDDSREEAAVGRHVGQVKVRGEADSVRYSLVFGDVNKVFNMDERTGGLSTASRVDREQAATYRLTVAARSGLAYGQTTINVTVLDVNDNEPRFSREREDVRLAENSAVGQEVYLAHAQDRDAGVNSRILYSLSKNPDDQFRIVETTGVVYLNRPILTEPGTSMQLEVTATDSGRPALSSKNTVVVTVEDVNDHTPVFDHTSYETSLLESTPVNSRFFALAASDQDLGANGLVSYSITEGDGDGKFGVFPDGFLYVRSALDREEKDYYALTVTARDNGDPPRSSMVPVVIHVVDENDNAPEFNNATFNLVLRENEPPDTFVGKLMASDKDMGRNAELTYSIASPNNDFTVDPRNGFIKTLHMFDREELLRTTGQTVVTLEAYVADNGQPRLRDKVKVNVYITDVNDNPPRFLRTPYRTQVSEGSTVGTQVLRVYTMDADEGLNGDVFYSILAGDSEGRFAIDEATGQIALARPLDRETVSKYTLQVVAMDAGLNTRLNSSTTVVVDVLDENDNAPEFTQSESHIEVLETTAINTRLIQFRGSDADLGVNSEVTFSITAGNRRDTFHVDPASGELYLYKPLDFEDINAYTLNITASDGGSPRLSTTIPFRVTVLDSNDNPPAFPNTAIVRQIREGIPVNTPIVTVTAEDPDSGANGRIVYSITAQEPEGRNGRQHFGINPSTGVVHTLLPIDRESVDTFRLTVVASDQAEPAATRLSAEKLVTVIVEDVNDNAPVFTSMAAVVLPASGDVVSTVAARDADSGSNGLVTYELVSGDRELFGLERSSGILSLRRPPNPTFYRYELAVKATDEAVQVERLSTDAYMTVLAAGEPGPEFQGGAVRAQVAENMPAGTSVASVRAIVPSRPDAAVELYVTNVTACGSGAQAERLFAVDPKLGVISTTQPMDREAGPPSAPCYNIEIFATVAGAKRPQTQTTMVTVSVLDRNDSPPSFRGSPLSFLVSEELAVGQSVATLAATDPDTIGELSYALVEQAANTSGAPAASPFTLDARTGVIRLRDALDREVQDAYRLLVRASDGVQATDAFVTIQVTDTNDNPPVFSQWAYSMEVREDAARGARVGQVTAKDQDEGPNGLVSYSVVSDWGNDIFALHPQTGIFTLASRLDYEEVQHYIFVVQASDAGRPSLSSTLTVFINVVDVNDNAPLFDPMSYSDEVWENVTAGASVVTVSATDLDSGANGRLEYAITGGDDEDEFSMSPNGTIVTRRALDREAKASYSLVVTATDCADPPSARLSSTVQVSITVRDVNDNAPEFITPSETSVGENVSPGTVLLAVKAVDKDEGRNGYVEYSLDAVEAVDAESGAVAASNVVDDVMFSLGPADGLLRVAGRLDREVRSAYKLRVTARDRGDPPRATTADVVVHVLDENDNSPVFDPKQYSATVAENASIGASVLQVSATDMDDGDNGRVRYSIWSGDDNRDFSISEDGGVVRVAKNLNFERKSRYVLTVRAEDCAGEQGSARYDTAVIAINVADINDNPPTFLDSPYLAYVVEGVVPPPNGFVLRVHAFDADSPPFNGQVRYFLKEGDPDLFRIDASTGDISLQRALDREEQAEHILTLVAMDTGTPPLTGSGTVRVVVQDVNDHSPEFEREGRQGYRSAARENAAPGTVILHAKATDMDEGLNARIRYSLLGEHSERFAVDADTGVVSLAAQLDREELAEYHLTLIAKDSSATDPRATAVNLTVTVLDENDNEPRFDETQYTVHVPAGTAAGEFVFGAEAVDADDGDNGRVRYSLSGDDATLFRCDSVTGIITAGGTLSTDPHRVYGVRVTARDAGSPQRSASADLMVRVAPAGLFPTFRGPRVAKFTLQEDVKEAGAAPRVVTRVAATSPKRGAAATIHYAIAGGNAGGALRVDELSGDVIVSNGLDYETAPHCEVWVEARDSDRPPLRSLVQLLVNVTDANDNAPVMEQGLYNASVMEEEFAPIRVLRVRATDRDSGLNGQLSYRLAPGQDGDGAFGVDPRTGEIFTKTKLDRETVASYQLQVEAVDEGRPQLTGNAAVLVTVLDKNDNPPRFSRLFSVNVTENSDIGTFVIRVTSTDLDEGENANATYSFTENPGEKFAIDPISGNVTVAGSLDREQHDEYVLKVAAVDGAWRQETPLTVTIQDVNDNAPEFEHSYYSFNFPELQPSGVAVVGQVTAADRDKQGPNSVISYSLKHPSDMFSVDPASGEVLSKRRLRYKHTALGWSPENQFPLTILATDNGKPPMSSECLVTVNVVDANNNAPVFAQHSYFVPVPESATVGRGLLKVVAKDDKDYGLNAELEYMKVGGNGSELLAVDKMTGKISLVQPLRAQGVNRLLQTYSITVRAVDKGVPPQSDETTVVVVVTGENKHSPVFKAPSSQVFVPENEPVGATILTVQADDADVGPNGEVRYAISGGNDQGQFAVHPRTGVVTIVRPLDYDTMPEHHLNITATDLGLDARSATASLTVMLTDINDNPPVFNQTTYTASIPENSPPGTVVFTARASDADSPKNAVIHYSIVGGSGKDVFDVDTRTGVVTAKIIFDYEERTQYTLDLLAANPDSSQYGSARLVVHITGVNEYYPRFVQPVFHLDVSEAAEVGTSVGIIQATDQDQGEDSKVYYLLVGSSNDRGFSIAPETGVVTVFRGLDRETQNRVVLTVMAKNAGSIRGNDTDEAQVIISIQDGNDPPEFLQAVYEAQVSEAAAPGSLVTTVRAVDRDVRSNNNQFAYSILGGSGAHSFKVDPQTGEVETTMPLDREAMSAYTITVGAIDSGSPPETGTTVVRVLVEDVNDNAPRFDDHTVGYVAENEPAGTSVMVLSATDADLPPNGAPFKYRLVGGRHRDLVTLDSATGLLRTAHTIDRETTDSLDLLVEVEDSGSPPQRAQHPVTVTVLDQNDSPSSPRALHLLVFAPPSAPSSTMADGSPPSAALGVVADVRPNDPDATGDYRCKMVPPGPSRTVPLSIPRACQLHANAMAQPGGAYSINVMANDGVHADVTNVVTVEIQAVDNDTVEGTVTVRVDNLTASMFLDSHYKDLVDVVRSALPQDDHLSVLAYSVQERDAGVEVAVAARGQRGYLSRAAVLQALQRRQDRLGKLVGGRPLVLGYSPCQRAACHEGAVCSDALRLVAPALPLRLTDSPSLALATPVLHRDVQCRCADGFTGARCDRRQDPCAANPCQNGGACRRQGQDYSCVCPAHTEGRHCERERGDACSENPCRNGGSCRGDGASFFCLCRPGFRGNQCEAVADSCRPNPCLHGGACVALKPGYRCTCPDGRYGRHCERSAFGFRELSYAAFPSLDASTNDISVVFATSKPDALLVYNFGAQTGGRSDFVALELVGGKAVFSFGGARTAISSLTVGPPSLADASWHKVTATRNGRVVSLSVAACTDNGDSCGECRPDDESCYATDMGGTGTLNFNGHPMMVGGLQAADPVLERPGQISNDDFVGCVHSVSVNGRPLNLSSPLHSRGVETTCGRPGSLCARTQPRTVGLQDLDSEEVPPQGVSRLAPRCGSLGSCVDRWTSSACECSTGVGATGVLAPDCVESLQPSTLADGAFLSFRVSDMHRRMQLLDQVYRGTTRWHGRDKHHHHQHHHHHPKTLSVSFRTVRRDGLILYAASNKDFTAIELRGGVLVYMSRAGAAGSPVNMTVSDWEPLWDGRWHNVTLESRGRALRLLLDGRRAGDELDPNGVHDFLDPYLTTLSVGGAVRDTFHAPDAPQAFEGCVANLTINAEVQPLNGSGSILAAHAHGKVWAGCAGPVGVGAAAAPDPLSIGITLVIVFFVILLVVILVSFVVFRLRRHSKEKGAGPGGSPGTTLVTAGGLLPGGVGGDLGRLHGVEGVGGDLLRAHHPELIAKKYKERDLEQQRPQRPDIIEREVVGKSPPLPMPPPPHHPHDATSMDPSMDMPEHYDLENASSIAPSDIDIVYHYKGYREGARKYKASPAPAPSAPPNPTSYHHKHMQQGLQQAAAHAAHRHTPFMQHPSRDSPRSMVLPPAPPAPAARVDSPPSVANSGGGGGGGGGRVQHQSTPLARLSPSSEVSSQPRILTLQDISGKPLQSALLATTSSSGTVGVGKDACSALHSNSERSLNSPVMSQLSSHSGSGSRKLCKPGHQAIGHQAISSLPLQHPQDMPLPNHVGSHVGPHPSHASHASSLAEEMQRFNHNPPRNSSLVSTLDAVSSTPHHRGMGHGHRGHMHHQDDDMDDLDDNHSAHSTTTDESGNDSFTCSEIEYDNNSVGTGTCGDVRGTCEDDDDDDEATDTGRGSSPLAGPMSGVHSGKPSLPPPPSYDGFDSSFRGSLSTLVASDDDLSTHMGVHGLGHPHSPSHGPHGPLSPSATALGWDYLLNWGPNFQSLVGVFKDIAELPDSVNGRGVPVPASLRLPASPTKPSEEYV